MAIQRWLLALSLVAVSLGKAPAQPLIIGPAPQPKPAIVEIVPAPVPIDAACDHTYFLVVNGADPLFIAKLNRFCDGIRCAGYKNVELYMLRQGRATEKQICCIRQNDPQAKIVLVGYSIGCNVVRKVCNSLDCQKVWVDMLVYIGGDYITDTDFSRPMNAGRIVNINGHGLFLTGGDLFFNGSEICGAANYRLCAKHFGLPKQPDTLGILLQHVAEMNAEKNVIPEAK